MIGLEHGGRPKILDTIALNASPSCGRYIVMRVLILLLSMLWVLGGASSVRAEGENLVNNPGFEEGQAGWTINTTREASTGGNPVEVVTGAEGKEVRYGLQALRIRSPSGVRHLYQGRRVGYADQSYKFSLWARNGGDPAKKSTIGVCLYLYGKDGTHLGSQNVTLYIADGSVAPPEGLKPEWQEFRTKIKVDEQKTPAANRFSLAFVISGDVVLDEVVLISGE